jgi:hypothetical protein
MNQAAAVDVKGLEDIKNLLDGDVPVKGPEDHVEVFLTGFESIEDSVQQELTILKAMLKEPKITPVQLDPESLALQVLKPAGPQVTIPVLLYPSTDRYFAQIVADFFALNPFENIHLAAAVRVDATDFHGELPPRCLRSVGPLARNSLANPFHGSGPAE